MTDRDLIARIRSGDARALGDLMEMHGPILLRLAAVITGSRDSARDVVQDVFMWVWLRGPELEIHGDVRGYLWNMARNRARNVVRSDRAQQHAYDLIRSGDIAMPRADRNAGPERLDAEELVTHVHIALASVPRRCREIFLLHWRDGLTKDEIAAALEIGVPTVRNQVARAIRRLADYFSSARV